MIRSRQERSWWPSIKVRSFVRPRDRRTTGRQPACRRYDRSVDVSGRKPRAPNERHCAVRASRRCYQRPGTCIFLFLLLLRHTIYHRVYAQHWISRVNDFCWIVCYTARVRTRIYAQSGQVWITTTVSVAVGVGRAIGWAVLTSSPTKV